eukprot:CAMPEP_0202893972 /NCGR_PEP_ID=MMETSP1392-20130828/3450_1 /ASSEMBLY_ACC=CAM_ASM_000868 /TAXON_ID=225041 /ORGANISM="Chlamydomonas chlamydogama, Strain SAG 11-48b" /LENGTH=102 /DNA_ID=CAMNT_0049578491 /DNA_START=485 /DNA_END=793 /DNA_ORIENTATION=-
MLPPLPVSTDAGMRAADTVWGIRADPLMMVAGLGGSGDVAMRCVAVGDLMPRMPFAYMHQSARMFMLLIYTGLPQACHAPTRSVFISADVHSCFACEGNSMR